MPGPSDKGSNDNDAGQSRSTMENDVHKMWGESRLFYRSNGPAAVSCRRKMCDRSEPIRVRYANLTYRGTSKNTPRADSGCLASCRCRQWTLAHPVHHEIGTVRRIDGSSHRRSVGKTQPACSHLQLSGPFPASVDHMQRKQHGCVHARGRRSSIANRFRIAVEPADTHAVVR